ncbi:SGNH/GDSL hydrolase family protein [Candidatus Woesearchaeota archaeon]|nr:SGNH/GDSL hydrolase family protein [Candidatus Woesearchaeota archaeon]
MRRIKKNIPKKITTNLLLLFAIILIFVACFEMTTRLLNIPTGYDYPLGMYQKDGLLDTSLTPNFEGNFIKTEFKTKIFTNSLGMFDVEYYEKGPDDFRLLALGDSFTWGGYGTSLNKTFLKIIEKKLNENSSINHQVMNSGVPGYGTDQQYLYLINRGYKLKPDIVLLNFFVGNDFTNNLKSGEVTVRNGYMVLADQDNAKLSNKIRSFLLMNLHSYRLIERCLLNLFSPFLQKHIRGRYQSDAEQVFIFTPQLLRSPSLNKTLELLDSLRDYTSSKKMDLVVVIIPLKYQVDEGLKEIFISNNNLEKVEYDMELPQKVVKEWGEKNKIIMIDLLPIFKRLNQDNDFYWQFNPHMNEKGNYVAGLYIYNKLLKEKVIRNDQE